LSYTASLHNFISSMIANYLPAVTGHHPAANLPVKQYQALSNNVLVA
jgi:hypothetical protein